MQEIEFNIPRPPQKQYTPAQQAARKKARQKRRAARRRKQIAFLAVCALVLGLLVFGLVKGCTAVVAALGSAKHEAPTPSTSQSQSTLPQIDAALGEPKPQGDLPYGEASYDISGYQYNAADPRLVLVNANLPLGDGYFVKTAVADDVTAVSLESEAAASYRAMASAAAADEIVLVLDAGYHDASTQQAIFDECKQYYQKQNYTEAEAHSLAQSMVAESSTSEHLTGYGADILSAEYETEDIGYASSDAFAWLMRYAAEYGFILRYPEDKQMITGRAYEPWHWRYVGAENAKAMAETGLTLEEFVEAAGVFKS